MFQTMLFEKKDNIAYLIFNRQTAMNAFDKTMADELKLITEEIREDKSIRAVLLKGAGALFMAGGDLHFFHHTLETMPTGVTNIIHTLNVSIINLMFMPKPVLASVHGSVAGVGISLMMACDLIIAADDTKFTLAYSGIGVSPDGGASYNLPRIVGTKKAMQFLLLPDIFDAKIAEQYGLINWRTSATTLEEETARLLKRLANGPTLAYAHTKRLVNQSWQHGLETQLELESRAFAHCTTTQDFKSGVTQFLKKQKPEFVGE